MKDPALLNEDFEDADSPRSWFAATDSISAPASSSIKSLGIPGRCYHVRTGPNVAPYLRREDWRGHHRTVNGSREQNLLEIGSEESVSSTVRQGGT